MFLPYWMGLLTFCGAFLVMILTVPWQAIKRFAVFGVVSGLGIGIALIVVMQNGLGLWLYQKVDFLNVAGVPLLLSAAWTPTEIFFAHFLGQYRSTMLRFLLILFIPAIAVGIQMIQMGNHMLIYHHWNFYGTYLLSLGIHSGIAYYLNRSFKIPLLP